MNTRKIIALAAVLFALSTGSAHAFDSERKGFQIGIGIGGHSSELGYQSEFVPASAETAQKFAFSYQVGYGFSDMIIGYLGGRGGSVVIDGKNGSFGIFGAGGSFYLSDQSPALYVTGLVGVGSLSMEDEDAELAHSGKAVMAGIGYEITNHLHLELSHARANLVDPNNSENTTYVQANFVTVQYLWY